MLEKYRVLAVEKEVIRVLNEDSDRVWVWQARADGVLEKKGGLEIRAGREMGLEEKLAKSVEGILWDLGGNQ